MAGQKCPAFSFRKRDLLKKMAERVGFEPTVRFPARSLSRRVLSTAQPPLRGRCSFNRSRALRFSAIERAWCDEEERAGYFPTELESSIGLAQDKQGSPVHKSNLDSKAASSAVFREEVLRDGPQVDGVWPGDCRKARVSGVRRRKIGGWRRSRRRGRQR